MPKAICAHSTARDSHNPVTATEAHGTSAGADAELIALADEIMRLSAETVRQQAEAEAAGIDDEQFYREVVEPRVAGCWDMRARLAQMQATSLAGFRAKARLVQTFNNCEAGFADPYQGDAMAWSLANDLLGVASLWEADDGESLA